MMAEENETVKVGAEEAQAVTGRPNDVPIREPEQAPLGGNSTLASRAAARKQVGRKQVDAESNTEDKSVSSASTKRRNK